MNGFDKDLRRFYEGISLSSEKLAELKQVQQPVKETARVRTAWMASRWGYAAMTAMLLITALSVLTSYTIYQRYTVSDVLSEIALNHSKPYKADAVVNAYPALRASLSKVDFALSIPSAIQQRFDLAAARYCSLSTQKAVHFKIKDKESGAGYSLFVAPVDDKLRRVPGQASLLKASVEGQRYWANQSLFYALIPNEPI